MLSKKKKNKRKKKRKTRSEWAKLPIYLGKESQDKPEKLERRNKKTT